jgi:hypothetical protein
MKPLRLFAVFLIFVLASVAWMVLGASNLVRTDDAGTTGTAKVAGLYGTPQTQMAPTFSFRAREGTATATGALDPTSSKIVASFQLDQRQKGLLWFATYKVDFAADYGVANPKPQTAQVMMRLEFPSGDGVYSDFSVRVNGRDVPVTHGDGAALARFDIPASSTVSVQTGYRTQGMNTWTYVPSANGASMMKDFSLTMHTDFAGVDFADGSASPTLKTPTAKGWDLTWAYGNVVSGRPISLIMPKPMNPGPLAYRIAFFAPVSLLFFFAGLVLLTATKGVKLHPVHYGFLAAAFFAFHLLFSYLADQVPLYVAFGVASAASVALVVGYLRAVLGRSAALVEIAISQFVFLVLFSYSFFFEGLTGLAVAIGSVATLGYYMAKTAKVDWDDVFKRMPRPAPNRSANWPPPAPPQGAKPVPPDGYGFGPAD